MLETLLAALGKLLAQFGLAWLAQTKAANDLNAVERSDAVQTAANETQTVVAETADARSQVAVPSDADALAAELRERAKAAGGGPVSGQ